MSSDQNSFDLSDQTFLHVSLKHIVASQKQPRKKFPDKSLRELAQSIKVKGVLQPLIVRKHPSLDNFYELVAGERRWRALKKLEVERVPVILRKVNDDEILEVALLENIQRENLTVIEEAQSYQDLLTTHGFTQEELALRIGKDRSTIANIMRLLQLPSPLKNDLENGRISSGHARAILALPDFECQLKVRERILRESWSVRKTEQQVRLKLDYLSTRNEKFGRPNTIQSESDEKSFTKIENDVHLQSIENELQHILRTKVKLKFFEGKGHIKIDFFSLDEFERLYDLLRDS